jgi:hypothetical protein
VIVPKQLLCPRISVLAVPQVVEFGNQATKLAPLNAHRAQLIFVVLGKCAEMKASLDGGQKGLSPN